MHNPQRTAFVTGANGYIGNAIAKAFNRAGWKTYGLIRNEKDARNLALNEIHPVIGSPANLTFLEQTDGVVFDVIISNTEDRNDMAGHLKHVNAMIEKIAGISQSAGVRPLVMFTSGCKDYGMMDKKHGDEGLAPHTESSPMNTPAPLLPRELYGTYLLKQKNPDYDAVVLRPTIVYGHSSSHYGPLFELASRSDKTLRLVADPNAVMHSLHVDDCAKAYVMLAEYANREKIVQQAYNISNQQYETARQIGEALARSYGLTLEFEAPTGEIDFATVHGLANFWQWVGSDKIRKDIGWSETKTTFIDGIEEYRLAYETHQMKIS
ncbi:epimerase [Erwinia typographi]|uniref:Epimerase n=2 Tax=Erwinia typographi TaxID=371042 RepID=A0A0A3Z986_9GAMM|nr:epimerase [Erwinia typographi]